MKIVLFAEELDIGGVGRHIVDLSNGLTAAGLEVALVAPNGSLSSSLSPSVRSVQIATRPEGRLAILSWIRNSLNVLSRELTEGQVIVHSHKRLSDYVARMAALQSSAVHVSTCHSWFNDNVGISCFGQWTVGISERISTHLVNRYRKPSRRVKTILNGIPDLEIQNEGIRQKTRSLLQIEPNQRVFVNIGHFDRTKDKGFLLRSLAEHSAELRRRNSVFILAGEGVEKATIQRYVGEHSLESIVRIVSGRHNMTDLWNIAECGVLSSRQEGLPYVILDAASLSIPHVATNVGGVSDFVQDDETGKLVHWNDSRMLGNAMLTMLDDDDLRLRCGVNARRRQVERHSYDTFIDNTIEFYKEVAS